MSKRDEFPKSVRDALAKRAAFICSNPDCRVMCISPAEDAMQFIYIGKAAHIHAAAPGGARYEPADSESERKAISNGIFLCAPCADMVDQNGGRDYPAEVLRAWKASHDEWVSSQLNKRVDLALTVVDGEHVADGRGQVIGLDVHGPAFFQPGTRSRATGEGMIVGTRIGSKPRKE